MAIAVSPDLNRPHRSAGEGLILSEALRAERAISMVRIGLCVAVTIRYLAMGSGWNDAHSGPRSLVEGAAAALSVGFSLAVLGGGVRKWPANAVLCVSILVDSIVCFTMLLPNMLWPGPTYHGILMGPDISGMMFMTLAAGFRQSTRLAVMAGVVNLSLTTLLVVIDRAIAPASSEYTVIHLAMWLILIGMSAALAAVLAWQTLRLVTRAASESALLERTRQGLSSLLHGHHDAHSLVASLALTTDLIARGSRDKPEVAKLAERLREDLTVLRSCVRQVREYAHGEVIASLEPEAVDLATEARRFADRAAAWLPETKLEVQAPDRAFAMVAGGSAGLSRVLLNLLTNARKGDGARGASAVEISVTPERDAVLLAVDDDGPGFQGGGVERDDGVGLAVVRGIAEASGGRASDVRSTLGGARVELRFPRARAE